MSTTQDGRLELDELGSVLDDAASLGDASETLGDADGAPTIGQRIAGSGVGHWAARHRGIVRAAAAVAVVAGIAFLVRTATAPPPPSPDVVATLTADASTPGALEDAATGSPLLTSALLVSGVRPGETVRVVGVEGPGVRTSTASYVGGPAPDVAAWSVAAVLDCDGTDTAVVAGQTRSYAARLERTDAWGRVATRLVDLPPGGTDWTTLVGEVCWGPVASRQVVVSDLTARADTARAQVTVGLDITSALGIPALVGVLADPTGPVQVGRSFLAPLVPGRVTQVDATLRVLSCEAPTLPVVPAEPGVAGSRGLLPGIPLEVQAARDSRTALVPVLLDPVQTVLVQNAIDQVCAGAPDVSATVVDVRRSAIPPSNGTVGTSAAVLLEVELRVTSSVDGAATVTLAYGGQQFPTRESMVRAPVQADGADGATVVVLYEIRCAATPPPPRLSVVVDVDGRARPWSRVLDDARIERAILDVCGGLTPEMLVTSGWPRPAR